MKFSRDWRLYVGGGAFAALIVWLHTRAWPPQPLEEPSTKGPPRWVELTDPFVLLFTGDVYRACVNVPGVVPNGFVASRIPERAAAFGFRDVAVQEGAPAGFPASSFGGDCDLFVQATWAGADGTRVDRPSAVTGAWRLARA